MGVNFLKILKKLGRLQNTISFELVVHSGKVRYQYKGEKARNSNSTSFL